MPMRTMVASGSYRGGLGVRRDWRGRLAGGAVVVVDGAGGGPGWEDDDEEGPAVEADAAACGSRSAMWTQQGAACKQVSAV